MCIMKVHKYIGTSVLKKYAHNIPQGSPILTTSTPIIPNVYNVI